MENKFFFVSMSSLPFKWTLLAKTSNSKNANFSIRHRKWKQLGLMGVWRWLSFIEISSFSKLKRLMGVLKQVFSAKQVNSETQTTVVFLVNEHNSHSFFQMVCPRQSSQRYFYIWHFLLVFIVSCVCLLRCLEESFLKAKKDFPLNTRKETRLENNPWKFYVTAHL